ncbi:hypothetical protein J6590_016936 [Homalodisca vitripennis]|nr:hypothetical protein J6590_016936 [Homalodisca vitripennis]
MQLAASKGVHRPERTTTEGIENLLSISTRVSTLAGTGIPEAWRGAGCDRAVSQYAVRTKASSVDVTRPADQSLGVIALSAQASYHKYIAPQHPINPIMVLVRAATSICAVRLRAPGHVWHVTYRPVSTSLSSSSQI